MTLDAFALYLKSPLSPFAPIYWISVGFRSIGFRGGDTLDENGIPNNLLPSLAGAAAVIGIKRAATDRALGVVNRATMSSGIPTGGGGGKGKGGGGKKDNSEKEAEQREPKNVQLFNRELELKEAKATDDYNKK
jgi:hypothetical protein